MNPSLARRLIDWLDRAVSQVMWIAFLAMMIALFWQVFSRFVINIPATWTEEAARYAFIYMAFFGAARGVRHSAHFGVTVLADRWRGRARHDYQRFVIQLPILVASMALVVYGMRYMLEFGFTRMSPTFHFPMAWVYLVVPLSAVPMSLFAAYNVFFEDFSAPRDSDELAHPDAGAGVSISPPDRP